MALQALVASYLTSKSVHSSVETADELGLPMDWHVVQIKVNAEGLLLLFTFTSECILELAPGRKRMKGIGGH